MQNQEGTQDEPDNPSMCNTNTASRRSTLKKQTNRKKSKQKANYTGNNYTANGNSGYQSNAYSPSEYNGNYSNAPYPTHSSSSLYGNEDNEDEDINIHNASTLSKSCKFSYNDVSPQSNSNHYARSNIVTNYPANANYNTSNHSLCNEEAAEHRGNNYYFDLDLCRDLNEDQHYYEPI